MKLDARAGMGTAAASVRAGGGDRRVGQGAGRRRGRGRDADRKRYLDSMM